MSKHKHSYILCPICQQHKFPVPEDYTFCPHCGWCHDLVSESEEWLDTAIGPNSKSFNDHKARYLRTIKENPKFHYFRDGYPDEE